MIVIFHHDIEVDDETVPVEFQANFVNGGFAHEFGYKAEYDLQGISFNSEGHTKEHSQFIKSLIWDGDLDQCAWDALALEQEM